MATLTEQLKKIENDILTVLNENGNQPMTQDQLFAKTHLVHMAEYGWSFALNNLEKQRKIEVVGTIYKGELLYKIIK